MVSVPGNKFPLPVAGLAPGQRDAQAQRRSGTLVVRGVQGTPDGPRITGASVEVRLYHRGSLIDTIQTALDEHGVVMIEDLPLAMDLQPVVLINHADLTYQKVGAVMDRANPEQTVEVTCYEPTDEEPSWKIRMRHVMLAPAPDGLEVTEVMMVENQETRTWTGAMRPGFDRPVTTVFPLPDGAVGVSLGRGFHDWCCTTIENNAVSNHLPIMPGATEMIYSYLIPARRGEASIDIVAPSGSGGVDQVMVLVSQELDTTRVNGLEASGTSMMGQMPVRQYIAAGVGPGERATLVLSGLSSSGDSAVATARTAKAAAAIGVIAIVLGSLWMILVRSPKKQQPSPSEPDSPHQDPVAQQSEHCAPAPASR